MSCSIGTSRVSFLNTACLEWSVYLACGKALCSFLSKTVTVTCSNWAEECIDRLLDSVHRTLKLHHCCCTKSRSPVNSKFSEAKSENAVGVINDVTYVESLQQLLQSAGLLFIHSLLIFNVLLVQLRLCNSKGTLELHIPSVKPIWWKVRETCSTHRRRSLKCIS